MICHDSTRTSPQCGAVMAPMRRRSSPRMARSEEFVMSTRYSKLVWTIGLMGVSAAALAGEPKPRPPQEPVGFVSGAVIGAFAGGPIGAVVGAGLGTWLGNRVHRASDAKKAEAQAAMLQTDNAALETEKTALLDEKSQLLQSNQTLTAKLGDVSKQVEAAQT